MSEIEARIVRGGDRSKDRIAFVDPTARNPESRVLFSVFVSILEAVGPLALIPGLSQLVKRAREGSPDADDFSIRTDAQTLEELRNTILASSGRGRRAA